MVSFSFNDHRKVKRISSIMYYDKAMNRPPRAVLMMMITLLMYDELSVSVTYSFLQLILHQLQSILPYFG